MIETCGSENFGNITDSIPRQIIADRCKDLYKSHNPNYIAKKFLEYDSDFYFLFVNEDESLYEYVNTLDKKNKEYIVLKAYKLLLKDDPKIDPVFSLHEDILYKIEQNIIKIINKMKYKN